MMVLNLKLGLTLLPERTALCLSASALDYFPVRQPSLWMRDTAVPQYSHDMERETQPGITISTFETATY